MTVKATTDTDIFLACLDFLCRALNPEDVVVMDNLSSHKVAGVRERIEAVGAECLYLPPDSPDLNPIEKAWSRLKQLLRSAKARTAPSLETALTQLCLKSSPATQKHGSDSPSETTQLQIIRSKTSCHHRVLVEVAAEVPVAPAEVSEWLDNSRD